MYKKYETVGWGSISRLTASQVRDRFADTLNRVVYRGERIVLRRRGKDLVAVVPMEDLALLEELEDKLDIEAAKKALAEPGKPIPYEKIRRELGLDR